MNLKKAGLIIGGQFIVTVTAWVVFGHLYYKNRPDKGWCEPNCTGKGGWPCWKDWKCWWDKTNVPVGILSLIILVLNLIGSFGLN
jgi:hypothetical protein